MVSAIVVLYISRRISFDCGVPILTSGHLLSQQLAMHVAPSLYPNSCTEPLCSIQCCCPHSIVSDFDPFCRCHWELKLFFSGSLLRHEKQLWSLNLHTTCLLGLLALQAFQHTLTTTFWLPSWGCLVLSLQYRQQECSSLSNLKTWWGCIEAQLLNGLFEFSSCRKEFLAEVSIDLSQWSVKYSILRIIDLAWLPK